MIRDDAYIPVIVAIADAAPVVVAVVIVATAVVCEKKTILQRTDISNE